MYWGYLISMLAVMAMYTKAARDGTVDHTEKGVLPMMVFVAVCPILNTVVLMIAIAKLYDQ